MLALLEIAFEPLEPALDDAEVGEDDFVLHRPDVARGSTVPAGCGTDGIAEHPHDVQQRVGVAERRDVEQRLRARLRPAGGAGDVGELHRRGHALARVEQRRQPVEPLVGDARDADVRVGLAAGRGASLRAGEELEEAVLPDEGKPMSPARSMRLECLLASGRGSTLLRRPGAAQKSAHRSTPWQGRFADGHCAGESKA